MSDFRDRATGRHLGAAAALGPLTQKQLGEAVGVSQATISLVFAGERAASRATLEALAEVLKDQIEELETVTRLSRVRSLTVAYPSRPASDNDDGGVAA